MGANRIGMVYSYKRGPPKAKRQNPELALQITVKRFLVMALPEDVEWTSSQAGVYLGPNQRAQASASGLRPGWPDLQFLINRRTYYIEMKAPTTNRSPRLGTLEDPDLSSDQRRILGRMHPSSWAICRSLDEVSRTLTSWGVVLKATVF